MALLKTYDYIWQVLLTVLQGAEELHIEFLIF
jgi:hypothetical protein